MSKIREVGNVAKKFVVEHGFSGLPKVKDFKLVVEVLPKELKHGEIMCQAEWLSVDPYMRAASKRPGVNGAFAGAQVARIVKSACDHYPEDSLVLANVGWRDKTILTPPSLGQEGPGSLYKLPDMKGLSNSLALGALGMPGNTAYFGLTRICKPRPGNTVVVSSAAGAVGSLVGQIGKILGCQVIGFSGTNEKVEWVKSLGFDHSFNYKTTNVRKALKEHASQGVDCYFDNVGGEFAYNVIRSMNNGGRIALCGAISVYNSDAGQAPMVPMDYVSLIYKNIRMEGFLVLRWADQWMEGVEQMRDWILEGKIKTEETVTEGFEQMPNAFIDMLEGKNIGKAVVKV